MALRRQRAARGDPGRARADDAHVGRTAWMPAATSWRRAARVSAPRATAAAARASVTARLPAVDEDHAAGVGSRRPIAGARRGQLRADRLCAGRGPGARTGAARRRLRRGGRGGSCGPRRTTPSTPAAGRRLRRGLWRSRGVSAGATTSANPDHAAPDTVPAASNPRKVRRSRGLGKAPNGSKEAGGRQRRVRGWSAEGAEVLEGDRRTGPTDVGGVGAPDDDHRVREPLGRRASSASRRGFGAEDRRRDPARRVPGVGRRDHEVLDRGAERQQRHAELGALTGLVGVAVEAVPREAPEHERPARR